VKNASYRYEDDKFDVEYGKYIEYDHEDCNSGESRLTANKSCIGSDLTYNALTASNDGA